MKINTKVFAAGLVPIGLLWASQVNSLSGELKQLKVKHQMEVDSILNVKDERIHKMEDHIFKLQVELEMCK